MSNDHLRLAILVVKYAFMVQGVLLAAAYLWLTWDEEEEEESERSMG